MPFLRTSSLYAALLASALSFISAGCADKHGQLETVTFRLNPQRTNTFEGGSVTTPLRQRWAKDLPGNNQRSYPLITKDSVYLSVVEFKDANHPENNYPILYAYDLATGNEKWPPVKLCSPERCAGAVYESHITFYGGVIYAVSFDGDMFAIDAEKGTTLWTQDGPPEHTYQGGFDTFNNPPVVVDGMMIASGRFDVLTQRNQDILRRVVSFSPEGGAVQLTSTEVECANLANSKNHMGESRDQTPALLDHTVYVGSECGRVLAFDMTNGTLRWWTGPTVDVCEFEEPPPFLYDVTVGDGLVLAHSTYTRESYCGNTGEIGWVSVYVYDMDGKLVRAWDPGDSGFAVHGRNGIHSLHVSNFEEQGEFLESVDLLSGTRNWRVRLDHNGPLYAGRVYTPLIVNGHVYLGTSAGEIFAFDELTGKQVWSDKVLDPDRWTQSAWQELGTNGEVVAFETSMKLVIYEPTPAEPGATKP